MSTYLMTLRVVSCCCFFQTCGHRVYEEAFFWLRRQITGDQLQAVCQCSKQYTGPAFERQSGFEQRSSEALTLHWQRSHMLRLAHVDSNRMILKEITQHGWKLSDKGLLEVMWDMQENVHGQGLCSHEGLQVPHWLRHQQVWMQEEKSRVFHWLYM